jgi:porin
VISNLSGGRRTGTDYLDNLDMTLTWHTHELLDFDAGTLFLYGLFNHGGDPSSTLVGDAQGVDNIEAPDTARLYEAWWQRALLDDNISLLAGLYDLNSEFDVIESATLFVHSSFGTGPELGLSGANGPSIFPITSLGVRLRTVLGSRFVWQTVVLDGVSGDPDEDEGTHVRFDEDDGLLIASEVAFIWSEPDATEIPMMRMRRRRVGRGWGNLPYVFKLALGAWDYTAKQPLLASPDPEAPATGHGHPGLYVLVDYDASAWDPLDSHGMALFARAGIADGDIGRFSAYVGGGIVYNGPIHSRAEDQLGFAVAAARNSRGFERAAENDGVDTREFEIALEWTYRLQLTPWLALQPDLQYVVHPGGIAQRNAAVVGGIRYEVRF